MKIRTLIAVFSCVVSFYISKHVNLNFQKAQPMIAKVLWENLLINSPDALGSINPYNERIEELFGNQGGH